MPPYSPFDARRASNISSSLSAFKAIYSSVGFDFFGFHPGRDFGADGGDRAEDAPEDAVRHVLLAAEVAPAVPAARTGPGAYSARREYSVGAKGLSADELYV